MKASRRTKFHLFTANEVSSFNESLTANEVPSLNESLTANEFSSMNKSLTASTETILPTKKKITLAYPKPNADSLRFETALSSIDFNLMEFMAMAKGLTSDQAIVT